MEIRSIQKTGGRSFTVTLPKKWVLSNRLQIKGRVKINESDNYLILSPFLYKKNIKSPVCVIDSMTKEQIYRELIGFYLSGTSEIIVRAKNITPEQRAAVREISYRLIGCECLESTGNQILLKNTSIYDYGEIPNFTNRITTTIYFMFLDTINYLKNNDKSLAKDVLERDTEIDRLTLGISRLARLRINDLDIEKTDKFTFVDAVYYEHVAIRLERIADHIVRIAEYFLINDTNQPIVLNRKEKISINSTLKKIEQCQKIIFSLDKKEAHGYLDEFILFSQKKIDKKYANKKFINLVLAESISRINSYIANIAEETINYLNIKLTQS